MVTTQISHSTKTKTTPGGTANSGTLRYGSAAQIGHQCHLARGNYQHTG